jgi:hypothetical protein
MKNKKLALEELAKDCQIWGQYCNGKGETCAVGRLAQLAGIDNRTLMDLGTTAISPGAMNLLQKELLESLSKVRKAIYDKFGLTEGELAGIQLNNDHYKQSREDRIKSVLLVVKQIKDDEE